MNPPPVPAAASSFSSAPTMETALGPGDRYDEFVILRELGTGSFARVYAVMSPEYENPVALKLSRIPINGETMAIRALREIRALQSLHNPHVVHILDHGVGSDERWYMIMELLRGDDLLKVHHFHEPMDPIRATRLAYEACVG
ncbi:MAG: protein kinase, partial [Myxococcales bacterium]|nr:protein kinase [Myxococcales bacterium]